MKHLTLILCTLILGISACAKPDKIVAGGFITPPKSEYPKHLSEEGIEGFVPVRVEIDSDGRILSATIRKSGGHPDLDKAALQAVRTATYRPTTVNGKPVRSVFTVPILFLLDQ